MQQTQFFYGMPAQSPYANNQYAQSPYANDPYGQTGYTGPTLYNYNNTGNANYGLYGNNSSMLFAESAYARMTGQTTSLSAAAIPNLATFQQPMTIDMNAFLGNTGIPRLPSFIGATAMNNPETPLYTSYQQYQQQNPGQENIQQTYNYQQPQVQQNYGFQQSFQPQVQQNFGFQQAQQFAPQQDQLFSMLTAFMGSLMQVFTQMYPQANK